MKLQLTAFLISLSYFFASANSYKCNRPEIKNTYNDVDLQRKCPHITYVNNVNMNLMGGAWYQHFATVNGSQAGCNGDCVTMYLSQFTSHSFNLDYCCNKRGKSYCGSEVGSALVEQTNMDDLGMLTCHMLGFEIPENIVAVQYHDHLLTYKCFYQGKSRVEIGEVWSRYPSLSSFDRNHLYKILNEVFADKSILQPVPQSSNCPYTFRKN